MKMKDLRRNTMKIAKANGSKLLLKKYDVTNVKSFVYEFRFLLSDDERMSSFKIVVGGNRETVDYTVSDKININNGIRHNFYLDYDESSNKTFFNMEILNTSDADFICKYSVLDQIEIMEDEVTSDFSVYDFFTGDE
jgi:hypothetical protein